MYIVRKGGTTNIPPGKDSADIHEALLLMGAKDPNCWDKGHPRHDVVNWLVAAIRNDKTANVSKANVTAVWQAMQPVSEKEQTNVDK